MPVYCVYDRVLTLGKDYASVVKFLAQRASPTSQPLGLLEQPSWAVWASDMTANKVPVAAQSALKLPDC
jgi:hypothetical protein